MFFNTHNANFFISYPKKFNYNRVSNFQGTTIIFNSYKNFEETKKNVDQWMDVDYILFEIKEMDDQIKSADGIFISRDLVKVYNEFNDQKNLNLETVDKNKAKDFLVL